MKCDGLSPTTTNSNRLSYNGKELDKDLNWYHYGARFYDPAVGRWWVVDPFDQLQTPYGFVGNNPLTRIDPDGNDIGFINSGLYSFFVNLFNKTNPIYTKASWKRLLSSQTGYNAIKKVENDSKSLTIFAQSKWDPDAGGKTLREGLNFQIKMKNGDAIAQNVRMPGLNNDGETSSRLMSMNLSELTGIDGEKISTYDRVSIVIINTHEKVQQSFNSDLDILGTGAFMLWHEVMGHIIQSVNNPKLEHEMLNGIEGDYSQPLYNLQEGSQASRYHNELKGD